MPEHRDHGDTGPLLAGPATLESGTGLEAYRAAVRASLAGGACQPGLWEEQGFLSPGMFRQLGAAGAFRQRWERGRAGGIRYASVLVDECTQVSGSLGLGISIHAEVFCSLLVEEYEASTAQVLSGALKGEVIGCLASTEPNGGSDLVAIQTTAKPTSAGWLIEGTKRFITNGSIASHAAVLARALSHREGQGRGRTGLTMFLIALDQRGVRRGGVFPTLGMTGCDTSQLEFCVEVADTDRLGPPGLGIMVISQSLQVERLLAAQQMITASRQALRHAVAYLRRRSAGGRRMLDHQALRHRLANALTELLSLECFYDCILREYEGGHPVEREIAALKMYAGKVAGHVLDESLQFLGGRGYTSNYPLERLWRDARLARIGGGTDEVMREIVAQRLDRADPEIDEALARLDRADQPVPVTAREWPGVTVARCPDEGWVPHETHEEHESHV